MDDIKPKDHGERVALFRSEIIGALCRRDLDRGELRAELQKLSRQRLRRPGADKTVTLSVPTLERWYYRYKKGGIAALGPKPRRDRGRARALPAAQRQLLCDIRREHTSASVPLILRTLVLDGRLPKSAVSPATVRRLYAEQGLDRVPLRDGVGAHTRLRWQAKEPMALWHADVCHGPAIVIGNKSRSLRIHALLDDASRFVVALEAHHTEREVDMLGLFVRAVRRFGLPDALYLDNGPTYCGVALRLACERLGVTLIHAAPYDAPARGKMERFWRDVREGVLDWVGGITSLHDVAVRLWAWLDQHYHTAPHAGLWGRAPGVVFSEAPPRLGSLDEDKLRVALTVRERRRVRRDTTLSVNGNDYELDHGYLAGRIVTVARCLVEPTDAPWIEHEGKRLPLHPVDAVGNATRRRPRRRPVGAAPTVHVPFDPPGALLDKASGKKPRTP
jgi:transposase InsO family protein